MTLERLIMTEENKKIAGKSGALVTFPITSEKASTYLDRLDEILGGEIVGKDEKNVSFPDAWLEQLSPEAKKKLFKELAVEPSMETGGFQKPVDTLEENIKEIMATVSKLLLLGSCNQENMRLSATFFNYFKKDEIVEYYLGVIKAIQNFLTENSLPLKIAGIEELMQAIGLHTRSAPATEDDVPNYVMFQLTFFRFSTWANATKKTAENLLKAFEETLKDLKGRLENYNPPEPAKLKTQEDRESAIKGISASTASRLSGAKVEHTPIWQARDNKEAYDLIKEVAKESVASRTAGCEGMAALTFLLAVKKGYSAHFCYLQPLTTVDELNLVVLKDKKSGQYFFVITWTGVFEELILPQTNQKMSPAEEIREIEKALSGIEYKAKVIFSLNADNKDKAKAEKYLGTLKEDKALTTEVQAEVDEMINDTPALKAILFPPTFAQSSLLSFLGFFPSDNLGFTLGVPLPPPVEEKILGTVPPSAGAADETEEAFYLLGID